MFDPAEYRGRAKAGVFTAAYNYSVFGLFGLLTIFGKLLSLTLHFSKRNRTHGSNTKSKPRKLTS